MQNKHLIFIKAELTDNTISLLSDCLIELSSSMEYLELDIIITSITSSPKLLKLLLWFVQTIEYNCKINVFYNFNLNEKEYYEIEEEFMDTLDLHSLNDLYRYDLLDYSSKIKTEEYTKVKVITTKGYLVYLPKLYNPELEI